MKVLANDWLWALSLPNPVAAKDQCADCRFLGLIVNACLCQHWLSAPFCFQPSQQSCHTAHFAIYSKVCSYDTELQAQCGVTYEGTAATSLCPHVKLADTVLA